MNRTILYYISATLLLFTFLSSAYAPISKLSNSEVEINTSDDKKTVYGLPSIDNLFVLERIIPGSSDDNAHGRPQLKNGLIIPSNNTKFAIEGYSGKRLHYENIDELNLIRTKLNSSYILFQSRHKVQIISLINGKKIFEDDISAWKVNTQPEIYKSELVYYFKSKTELRAFNCETQSSAWIFKTDNRFLGHKIITDDNIFLCDREYIYCLSAVTGAQKWKTQIPEVNIRPVLDGPYLYLVSNGKGVYCLDSNSGKIKWHYKNDMKGFYDLIKDGNNLYYLNSHIYSLDIDNGQPKWVSEETYSEGMYITDKYIISYCDQYEEIPIIQAVSREDGKPVYACFGKGLYMDHPSGEKLNYIYEFTEPNGNLIHGSTMAADSIYTFRILQ